jgi:adenylylsulfate reductase subunit A
VGAGLATESIKCEVLVIGGGAAGCAAALALGRAGLPVLVLEKAGIDRSGCLAAGVNAINAWVGPGKAPEDYADYALRDAHGIAAPGLLLGMSRRLGEAVGLLSGLGLEIHRAPDGSYLARSWRNLRVNGENIKPLLAAPLKNLPNVRVIERAHALNLLLARGPDGPRARGALALSTEGKGGLIVAEAGAVICATGGASGIYRPNNPGMDAHKMWYPPFNTGGGYAFGILAGAELTTLEMRFVALRCKDTAAPTGTLALGAGARQLNALGNAYEDAYGNSTSQRVLACRKEEEAGRGPCRMVAEKADPALRASLARAYFHMAPLQSLRFLEEGGEPAGGGQEGGQGIGAFVEGTEPYIIGGHTASGYFVNASRETTVPGLFAAGDVAGGCPQKYVSGSIAEGLLAAEGAQAYLRSLDGSRLPGPDGGALSEAMDLARLSKASPYEARGIECAMQKAMDSHAGGRGSGYRYSLTSLKEARREIRRLYLLAIGMGAGDPKGLSRLYEVRERLVVADSLISHLLNRRETRWPGFGEYLDYPDIDERYELFLNSVASGLNGTYPRDGLPGVTLLARGLVGLERLPLPEPQEDPPLGESVGKSVGESVGES